MASRKLPAASSSATELHVVWVALILLLCSCVSGPSPPAASPTPSSYPAPSLTAEAVFTVAPPTPTATPVPTLDPDTVVATIAAGEAWLEVQEIEPVCLRRQDTDDDGDLEWVGLHLQPGEPPQLVGFVLDGGTWHDLAPPEAEGGGLGEYATCELEVRDLNGDGRTEVVICGHAGTSTDLLHIFAWDGTHYALLGAFEGEGGVRLEDGDGDSLEEAVVGLRPEGSLVVEIVYTWDGTHYAWTWDRYAWFYLDRPHAYPDDTPTHALASFYLALDDRDLPEAYSLLSAAAQATRSYEEWALGYTTTLEVEVGAARVVNQVEGWSLVAAQVRALDNVHGTVVATVYDVEWELVETGEGWRLETATSEVLDQWEVEYYR